MADFTGLQGAKHGFKHQVIAARSDVNGYQRERDDFYATPPEATEALLRVETFAPKVWEPACGDGAISKILKAHGHDILSSDIIERGYDCYKWDFLLEWGLTDRDIVTNPPFKLGLEFAQRAVIDLGARKVAMLNKLLWLEGQERAEFFKSYPPARVWIFSKRLSFGARKDPAVPNSSGLIAFAWFVWERGFAGKTTLGWI